QALVKIIRTLPARLLINEVAFGHRPWCGEKVLNGREEGLRQSPERISIHGSRFDQPLQDTCFLSGHTHSLPECRTESTNDITERQQTIWKAVKFLKVSPYTAGKAEPVNRSNRYSVLDRVMDCLGSQGLCKIDKFSNTVRHVLTMHAG